MKKSKISLMIALAVAGGVSMLFSGCRTEESYRDERKEKTAEMFNEIKSKEYIKGTVLTLDECISFAMQNNLSVKVANMERDVRERMRTADVLGMLPDVTISDNYTSRNNLPGSSSKAVVGDGATFDASRSSDKRVNNFSIDFAFSVLDCGLAFFNSQQTHDRMLQQEKAVERLKQNLALDVAKLYFRVAVAQRAATITRELLAKCQNRYELIRKLHREKKISSFLATEEMNKFLAMEHRLRDYIRTNETAQTELRAVLGVYPGEVIKVDDSLLDKLPEMDIPDTATLEQIAVLKRPELYETDMQKHINILECRKTLLMMLPNVRLYGDYIHNNNSFLMHQTWWELAVRAAYNLLKTPQYIYRYKAFSEQASLEELRSFVQAVAVMSQVRMATADILSCRERYEINVKDDRHYTEHLAKVKRNKMLPGTMTQLQIDHLQMVAAETRIEKLISMGACHIANYRLLNALGIGGTDAKTIEVLKQQLALARERAKERLEEAKKEFDTRMAIAEEARIARILFEDGLALHRSKKLVEASEYMKRAAEKGNAEAYFCLGKMYWAGSGVEKDLMKAMDCFVKSADLGKKEAQILTGWSYYKGGPVAQDLALAKKYYRMAADNADERAFYWLGMISFDMKDYKDAMYYFKYAARGGDVGSMVWVGTLYRNGLGEKVDYDKAIFWFKRAAEKNNVDAMNSLYMMYAGGYGCPPDKVKAAEWLKKYEEALASR
ncbi:MAG: SEL1-like repeat protein [Lentisphaeria bacterium]|nr:SEL1-like repeat protein [Lentisphaeria bacterium]